MINMWRAGSFTVESCMAIAQDLCIDDGCHEEETILYTMNNVAPHLSENFVYVVEDNSRVDEKYNLNSSISMLNLEVQLQLLQENHQ